MSKSLFGALILATVAMMGAASHAQAKAVWVYPFKGTAYVLPEGHAQKVRPVLKAKPALSHMAARRQRDR